jgi:serine/threonine protein kinase/tetratricopeptide (TPR) repeat protein
MKNDPKPDVALFAKALELPASERAAFLDRACGDDLNLRQWVEDLLRAHDTAGDFLQNPAADAVRSEEAPIGEQPGDFIGHYKLLQKIGEGGCGVVYMAEQAEPVRRLVALKVIRPGMDTRSVIARFEAERQALALMDHPNIAKVFDAGATKSGRPFFVMELVKGVKITDYCDQESLTTAERLDLFVQVCQAIQHAHQKGIIHRDIKPSNILVTKTEQGAALPMVIDFGIAKATTNQRLTDRTVFTALEMLIGTPAYMSPEQAEMGGVDVDTRSDIYSLGVLLYELLTGSTPFDSKTAMKAGLDEVRRLIREKEPARPSTRLSTMNAVELTATAHHRHAAPLNLIRSVRGDLDWIVMKALEKDRSRRYATANGMALDVQRHLANEAISARPPSSFYRFQKLVLRNKLVFTGLGLIAAIFLGSSIIVWSMERRARQKAVDGERKARNELDALSIQAEQDQYYGKLAESEKHSREALAMWRKRGESGSPQALDESVRLYRILMNQTRFDEAEQVMNEALTPELLRQSISADFLDMKVEALGHLGRWQEASAAATRAFENQPINSGRYPMVAALLLKTHNRTGYDQFCKRIFAMNGTSTNTLVADAVAKSCLFAPSSEVDLEGIGHLANTAVTFGVSDSGAMPFFQVCKALSEYRLGHFSEAAEWAQKSGDSALYASWHACGVLAMANWQLGKKGEARAMLARGQKLAPPGMPANVAQSPGNDWLAWLYARIQLDEAEALMKSSQGTEMGQGNGSKQ